MMRPPLVVLDVDDVAALTAEARTLARAGWSLHRGLDDVPLSTDQVVCLSTVEGPDTAAAAVLAASWGAGLLLAVGATPPEVLDRLLDDLRRLGPVRRTPSSVTPAVSLESAQLLDQLIGGASLKAASEALFLSRRTADRRLAAAREQLGAATTAEALVAWAQRRSSGDDPQ